MYLVDQIKRKMQEKGSCMVSVIGAGGKTTTLFALAKGLKYFCPVVLTTTTAMIRPDASEVDDVLIGKELTRLPKTNEVIAWFDRIDPAIEGKVRGICPDRLNALKANTRPLLILNEADGAARKPFKVPLAHEPVIPSETDIVILVVGLDALYKPITDQWIHRSDRFFELTQCPPHALLEPYYLNFLMHHPEGLLKNCPQCAEVYLVLNKCSLLKGVFFISDFSRTLPESIKALVVAEMQTATEVAVIRRD